MTSPLWDPGASLLDDGSASAPAVSDVVEVARDALGFLVEAGLVPLPDRRAGRHPASPVTLGWVAPTFTVLAGVESGSRFGLLIVGTDERPSTIDQLVDRARGRSTVLVSFGAFWLSGSDRPSLEQEVDSYVGLFRDALGPPGRDVDPVALQAVFRAHEERLARGRMVPWLIREAEMAWQRRGWARYLGLTDQLAGWGVLLDDDRRAYATAQLGESLPERAWPPTVEAIRQAADRLGEATHSPEVMSLVFGRMITYELSNAMDRLRAADPTAVEPTLVFLEADPWAFRTGYLKQRVMRWMRRCPIDAGQAARLRVVLLHLVDVGGRREFREACRLAHCVADPSFMEALRARVDGGRPGISDRARWMLAAIRPSAGT